MIAPKFGIYVHWPYCARICPYCDFNVYRARDRDPAPLMAAIAADLRGHRARLGARTAETVFLGGGTPSLLSGADVGALIAAVDAVFPLTATAEISLEANPEDHARFADHAKAAVNRFSIGVQALNDADLSVLGRVHDAAAGVRAVMAAAETGARVSADFIYARHGQTQADWAAELKQALALPVEHLSLYQLTIEPNTAFARAAARGRIVTPGPEPAADFYELTQSLCAAAGMPAYEISNHASGATAQAQHNLLYWTSGEWVGVGPGAHGRVMIDGRRFAAKAHDDPQAYIDAVRETGLGWESLEPLSAEAQADEYLIMGLRLAAGIPLAPMESLRPLNPSKLAQMRAEGWLTSVPDRLQLTPAGRLLANRIAAELAEP